MASKRETESKSKGTTLNVELGPLRALLDDLVARGDGDYARIVRRALVNELTRVPKYRKQVQEMINIHGKLWFGLK